MGLCCSLPTLYVDVQWVDIVFCLHCIWMFNGYMLFFAYTVCGCSMGIYCFCLHSMRMFNGHMLFFAYTVCGCSMGICCSLPSLYVDVQ